MTKKKDARPAVAAGGASRASGLKRIDGHDKRLLDLKPQSYDATEHTVELVLSEGGAVARWYGIEALSVEETAVCVDRLRSSGIPFLDSHITYGIGSVIGRIVDVWFAEGKIFGRAKFGETDAAKVAEGMVARGEISGISIGYRVDAWTITDPDGTVIDPEMQNVWAYDNLTFTATRWELLEASLVSVPADPAAMVRSHEAAPEGDLRATPMGRDAREITVALGDRSVTYRYGAAVPHERAMPATSKEQPPMSKRARATSTEATRGRPAAVRTAPAGRASRADDAKTDDDGNLVDDDGNYVDEDGKAVDEPVKARGKRSAKRDDAKTDDDGNLVDDDGNYVDEDGEPSDEPVKAERDGEIDDGEDDRGARRATTRSAPRGDARQAPQGLTRAQTAEVFRIVEQARGLGIDLDGARAIERGDKPDALRKRMFDKLAERGKEKGPVGNTTSVQVLRDEAVGRRDAMELALVSRILGSRGSDAIDYAPKRKAEQKWVEAHRARSETYASMGFVEIAAECIGHRGNIRTSRQALDVMERAFETTSDFPAIFQNVLNKTLMARYELAEPTYKLISVERTFKDFRPHPMVRAGEFPTLQPVNQAGELKSGGSADSGENISLVPYGIIFPISRQMIVNDELGAIDQILGSSGDSVRLFENTTFFAMFNSNPVLAQNSNAVFSAANKTLAPAGSPVTVAAVGAGRAKMRAMRSLSNLLLNVPPRIILTGPTQETAADQLVATISPQLSTSVNPFSGKLQSVSDANITDDSWYLLADPARIPNFVHGFLDGATGPRVRTYEPFGTQGVQMSLEHDFAVGAVDFRGGWRNPGAPAPQS